MNETQAAWYVAGVFDGEGHVEGWRDGVQKRIVVTNTDTDILDAYRRCLDVLGIEYRSRPRRSKANGHRRGTEVIVSQRSAVERFSFLVPIMSYVKRSRVDALVRQQPLGIETPLSLTEEAR